MSDDKQQVNELLKQVLSMETQQAFDFLAVSDAKDAVVNQVALLLSPSVTRTAFMEGRGLLDSALNEQAVADLSGSQIQNIKIIKPLGHGGMGAVYLAEDTTLKRQVAVKVLHNSNQLNQAVQERFRREALILSQLDHPNICRIYNLIEAETVDYLVLELIVGETLKQVELKKFSQSRKFEIALALLKALKVAHSKNIIHRDLKPENIMLDKSGQVKVLDFGISRLSTADKIAAESQQASFEVSNHTLPGAVLGTLTYMSPEQAAGEELTTASDMYTLGLVFQELFSDTPVYAEGLTAEQLLKHSTAAETQVPTDLSKDLTLLIQRMKSKSAAERPTAIDAIRLLENIQVKPAKRLKYALIGLLLLVTGLGIFKHINDLNHERDQANMARDEAEQITEFLTSIFKVSNPYYENSQNITAFELLENGAERIETELAGQPQTQAYLRASIGNVYRQLGMQDKAKPLLEKAYEQINTIADASLSRKAEIIISLGTLAMTNAEYEQAKMYYDTALAVMPKGFTKAYFAAQSNLAIYYSRTNQYEQAKALNLQLIDLLQQHDPGNIADLSSTYNSLGMVYFRMDQPKAAIPYFEQGLELINHSEETLLDEKTSLMGNLALVKNRVGERQEALALSTETLKLREQILPANHPDLILAYDNLAVAYYKLDDMQNAKHWNQKALNSFRQVFKSSAGNTDQNRYDYAMTLANYGVILRNDDNLPEAKETFTEVVDILLEILGEEHQYVADYTYELGQIAWFQRDVDTAIEKIESALRVYQKAERPLASRHLKSWLLKAEILYQRQQIKALEGLQTELMQRLNTADPFNQESIDLAVEKFQALGLSVK